MIFKIEPIEPEQIKCEVKDYIECARNSPNPLIQT